MSGKSENISESATSPVKAWIEAIRLRTLPAGISGVAAGSACAIYYDSFRWSVALICLLFAIGAQIAANFANEYYDYKNGLDRKGRDGFRRGVTEGDISPQKMKIATYATLAVTSLLGLTLVYWGGLWLIPLGIVIAIFALAYSTGPWPLSHHGLGDVTVLIFFGLIPVWFTAWLQTGSANMWPVSPAIAVAVGLMAVNILIVNNYRDADDDRKVNKKTTVVRFGRKTMSTVYLINGTLAAVLTVIAFYKLPLLTFLLPYAYEQAHIILWQKLRKQKGKSLNKVLAMTGMLMLAYSLLLLICMAF